MDRRAEEGAARRRGLLVEALVCVALAALAAALYFGFLRAPARPNVILISIDTLRPDHLGCYGYDRPTSPAIDRCAAEGARFTYAHSSTSWTLAAHMSLMTGLPDELHEVVWDRVGLDPERVLLAERFHQAGYVTGGFFGGPYLHAAFGFGRGFDLYENCGQPTVYDAAREGMSAEELALLTMQKEAESHRIRTADTIQAHVDRFLERNSAQPFFLFIHHWDCHYDFNAPREFVDLFAPGYTGSLSMKGFMTNPKIAPGMDARDFEYLVANYDAEIRWVDHQVGRLRQKLEELGIADDTYVIITSDHGEEFFEHGNKGHRWNLHEETLAIPLIIAGPGVRHGLEIDASVRIFDVLPTILDLAGLPPVEEAYGVTLRPLLDGDEDGALRDLPIVAELTYIPKEMGPGGQLAGSDHFFKHTAVGRGRRKLVQIDTRAYDESRPIDFTGKLQADPQQLLFDHTADPRERSDLAAKDPRLLEQMLRYRTRVLDGLRAFLDSLRRTGRPAPIPLPPDVLKQLLENGYLMPGKGEAEGK
ncbi:MAG: sulfatase [Planctomycetes bacterium]|nr:sulfatase [Planctomycetota bacterium]